MAGLALIGFGWNSDIRGCCAGASVGWWLTALLALPLLTVIIAVLFGDTPVPPSGSVLWAELLVILVAWLLINLWEKRRGQGFCRPGSIDGTTFFVAAFLTGIPFAAIHLPLQVITGEVRSAVHITVGFTLLMVLVVFVRSLFGMVLRGAGNSLLLVALTHAMFNRSKQSRRHCRRPPTGQ